ncbi:MAG TPA: CBS domain-containing protein [Candidatus Saccharimonadales bacterium]
MSIVLVAIAVVFICLLILTTSVVIQPSEYSQFELERRYRNGDAGVEQQRERMLAFDDLISLQRVIGALLLVISVIMLVVAAGWLIGIPLAVLLALQYGALARIGFIHTLGQKAYDKYESKILQLIKRYPKVMQVLRTLKTTTPEISLHSREELLDLVTRASGQVLSRDERALVTNGLLFVDRKVSEVMTPRSVIDTIKKGEILGPLVLDDLHKTGHNRFPVIDGDLDHVVGVLLLRDVLTLDTTRKHTAKVETAMDPRVYYIHESQSLEHALAAFLKTRHHLFVVVNEYRETVGILSLEDVIEALLGRKINDEFDTHDDLRVVAARNPRGNNSPPKSHDV